MQLATRGYTRGGVTPEIRDGGTAMKMYRCRICGETYLGSEPPAMCPFCGAHVSFMIDPADYPADINEIQLTEVERADLETAIDIELSNTRFYLAMSRRDDNAALASAYKRLAAVESEHCSLFSKIARTPKPADLREPGDELGSWDADIDESARRERRASALYAEFSARATSERLIEVWKAVSAVEADHIELDALAKRYV
jgi:rubrerythrin/DNA-directed RNA polymerase subunit RPC12/RpoP